MQELAADVAARLELEATDNGRVPTQLVASTARSERVRDLAALAEHAAAAARTAGEAARRGQQKEVLRRAAREVGGRWRTQLEVRRSTSHQ